MRKSTKAALLSAFIFPGVGHIYLKKHVAGTLLAGASLTALYHMITKAIAKAFEISEKIQSGDVQPDIKAITELVSQQSGGSEAQMMNIATIALVACWLIGIVDSYRSGRVQEKPLRS